MLRLLIASLTLAAPPAKGLTVPGAFEITEFADSALANDITCMTIDPKGRIVVAGRGYIRVLVDRDGDGRADQAIDVTRDVREHAMGLLWEGDTLLAVVDGGLWRFRIGPDGTTAAGKPERLRALRCSSDHHAHALRRGPDGWLYLIAGDSTGIDATFATTPASPIRTPVAGCLLRFSPDFKQSEIVADGFRNPYCFDFDLLGNAWTFDADNERCVSLPWYEPTRIYRIVPGGHHGWRAPQLSETWRCPPYFVDVVPPVATCGRGSPTGVVFHRHTAWPRRYRGLFVADWTFGKVWRWPANFPDKPEPFIEADSETGFAPTALAVHPQTGDLYVSIGGRGTRGAVYRVHLRPTDSLELSDFQERSETVYNPRTMQFEMRLKPPELLQPHVEFGADWKDAYRHLLPARLGKALTPEERLRVLVDLRRHHERFDPAVLLDVAREQVRFDGGRERVLPVADLIAVLPAKQLKQLRAEARTPWAWVALGLALRERDPPAALDYGLRILELDNANRALVDPNTRLAPEWRLQAVRLVQLALGDLSAAEYRAQAWAGYSPRRPLPADRYPRVRQALRSAYPSGAPDLDRELTRTLAMLEDDDAALFARIVARLTDASDPLDDVHHLIVLSRLRGPRRPEWTAAVATALLGLDVKIARLRRNRDRNWPLRIAELHAELSRKDPALNAALLHHADFGRPDHALFARAPGLDRRAAAELFVQYAERTAGYDWNAELVGLLGELPARVHVPLLRSLAKRGGLDDAILPLLARSAESADLGLFLGGLASPRLEIVRDCLAALARLELPRDGATALALVRCLRLLPEGKEADRLRGAAGTLLERVSGQQLGSDRQRWADWLARAHPDLAAKLGGADGVDVAGWRKRLGGVNWNAGSGERGRSVFTRASCAACHSGSQAMGPDLAGAAGRFARDDLFTAILQPSKEVPVRYRMTQIETTDGKTYQGLIVYEAVDGLILQTGPAQTIRLPGERIESKRLTEVSLMPTGLLDKLTDAEIADLYAYLKTLTKASP